MKNRISLIIAVTAALVAHAAPHQSEQTDCLRNGKQIALAAIMLAADHNEKFAFTGANYRSKLMPYMKNSAVVTCPLDKAGVTSYTFNPALANVSMSAITRPAETVLFYEGKGGKLNFRHDGKAIVAYCDGHVKTVQKGTEKRLVWKP